MKKLLEELQKIWAESKGTIALMLLNLSAGVVLLVGALASLRPGDLVIKIGYGDVSGYQDGAWYYLISFGILGILVAVVHNLLAVRMYHEKNKGAARIFLVASLLIGVAGWMMLMWIIGDAA